MFNYIQWGTKYEEVEKALSKLNLMPIYGNDATMRLLIMHCIKKGVWYFAIYAVALLSMKERKVYREYDAYFLLVGKK